MKPRFAASCALIALALALNCASSHAQGTSFVYQGRLAATNGIPISGRYDFRFTLFDTSIGFNQQGPTLTNAATLVTNGLFSTTLDFGNVFSGGNRWLEIAVRTNGAGSFTTIQPRQSIQSAPYAMMAASAGSVPPGTINSSMLAGGAVTTDKIAAGAVQTFQIDDGGNAAYESFLKNVRADERASLGFTDIYRISPTNAVPPSLSLTLGGSTFGTVVGFSGEEALSRPYSYVIEVRTGGIGVDPATKLGMQGRLSFTRNGKTSYYGGIVTACTMSGVTNANVIYTVRLEPRLAHLAQNSDYRIYQDVTAVSVAQSVYQTLVGDSPTLTLTASYTPRENVVQYNETSLSFFNRLLEGEGVFYFFNHSTTVPGLTLGDSVASYLTGPSATYYGNVATNFPAGAEYIRTFEKAAHPSTLSSTVKSYNFASPGTTLQTTSIGTGGFGTNYEFGTAVKTSSYVSRMASVRQGREAVERVMIQGSSIVPELHAGYTFSVTDSSSAGIGGSYVVTSVRHAAFVRVTNGVSTVFYGNQFEAIPASLNFRPALTTPKPLAQPSTAVVTGPAGETTFVDQYGRVKVQFHWDRHSARNEGSSAWLRVLTPVAGSTHSMLFLPRVGDEVLVSFIQGDPDSPLVSGSLYNGGAMPPYALPGNHAVSTIRSTSTGGQVNELKFDDTNGSESVTLRGGRQLNLQAGSRVDVASPMSINGGTIFTNYLAGQTVVGSCPTVRTNYTITFPKNFSTTPKVVVSAQNDPGWNVNDTFATSVRSVSTSSFVVNVVRVDTAGGWSQALRINWTAWE